MTVNPSALQRFGEVSVRLAVELGRAEIPLRDVLGLSQGSVVPLNRLTDELLVVTANGKLIARAEVIAQDGRFAVRIVELEGAEDTPSAPSAPSSAGSENAPAQAAAPAQQDVGADQP